MHGWRGHHQQVAVSTSRAHAAASSRPRLHMCACPMAAEFPLNGHSKSQRLASDLLDLARPEGLEPPTRCLEGSRSPPPRWVLENSLLPRVSVCFHSGSSPPSSPFVLTSPGRLLTPPIITLGSCLTQARVRAAGAQHRERALRSQGLLESRQGSGPEGRLDNVPR